MAMASITPLHERRGINNRLLLALPPVTLERMLRISEPVSLVRGQQIETIGQPIKYIHFVNRGLVCATKTMEDGWTRVLDLWRVAGRGADDWGGRPDLVARRLCIGFRCRADRAGIQAEGALGKNPAHMNKRRDNSQNPRWYSLKKRTFVRKQI
jgi:hypothetical protein